MESNNKVTKHKYGHRGLNEFNKVNDSVAKREFYMNRMKKEDEALMESTSLRNEELKKNATILDNVNNRKINEIKMVKAKDVLYESVLTKLVKVAFTEAFMESLYLDDTFKIDNSVMLESVVDTFVDDNGGYKLLESAVKQNKDSLFLKSIYEACKATTEKICKEKCKDCDEPEKINFDVRLEDIEEFKTDLSKTNIDTLGDVVKDKVLKTVVTEKERSIKKQEFEDDINNEIEGAVTESLKYKIHSKNVFEEPSLFSAMMRSNYKNILEESVANIQSYRSNDRLSEIGLDETEVDYNDKNEHSLTNLDSKGPDHVVNAISMRPEDNMDNFNAGNSAFDNSAIATVDEESDDMDMFALTTESNNIVNEEPAIESTIVVEVDEESTSVIWSKFVPEEVVVEEGLLNSEMIKKVEDTVDDESAGSIEDILESFTIVNVDEALMEASGETFKQKVKRILQKIFSFFRTIKDKIFAMFTKKITSIKDTNNEIKKKVENLETIDDAPITQQSVDKKPHEIKKKVDKSISSRPDKTSIDKSSDSKEHFTMCNPFIFRDVLVRYRESDEVYAKLIKKHDDAIYSILYHGKTNITDKLLSDVKNKFNELNEMGYDTDDQIKQLRDTLLHEKREPFNRKMATTIIDTITKQLEYISKYTMIDIKDQVKYYLATEKEVYQFVNMYTDEQTSLLLSMITDTRRHVDNRLKFTNGLISLLSEIQSEINTTLSKFNVNESFTSVLDEEEVFESVLDEYESVLEESTIDEIDMTVMEAAVDSFEFDEDDVLYEEIVITDDFIKDSVAKMSDKDLQKHLPNLEKMIVDLNKELKIAKGGELPSDKADLGPIRKLLLKVGNKINKMTPEKAAKNIQEMITIGKKEITFVKAELKKRGLKAVSESFVDDVVMEGIIGNVLEPLYKKIYEKYKEHKSKNNEPSQKEISANKQDILSERVSVEKAFNTTLNKYKDVKKFFDTRVSKVFEENVNVGDRYFYYKSLGELNFGLDNRLLSNSILDKFKEDLFKNTEFMKYHEWQIETEDDYLSYELVSRVYPMVTIVDKTTVKEAMEGTPEYVAMEAISTLGDENKLRVDQRRKVVRLCESLSVGELASLTAKYRNEAVYLTENMNKLSNMNDMDKAVHVYEASINHEGYNFNEELTEIKSNITKCNESVGLFNIAAKILITLESLGLTEACKKGKKKSICSECGDDLVDSKCKDCGLDHTKHEEEPNDVVEESTTGPSAEVMMDKVLCESLIQYTLLEMMHTAKVVSYTSNDVRKMAIGLNK